MVLEKTLDSPLDCQEIQVVYPKGDQSWLFTGRTDAETETPILWPPDAKNWFPREDPVAGKDWRWEEKGTTEDEIVGAVHGVSESDMTEQLNWTELKLLFRASGFLYTILVTLLLFCFLKYAFYWDFISLSFL